MERPRELPTSNAPAASGPTAADPVMKKQSSLTRTPRCKTVTEAELPPSLEYDQERKIALQNDASITIGIDEAGRGCLAGPVVACAAYASPSSLVTLQGVTDSKAVTETLRERIFDHVTSQSSVLWGLGSVSAENIDKTNILEAALSAMTSAISSLVSKLPSPPLEKCLLLFDGNKIPQILSQTLNQYSLDHPFKNFFRQVKSVAVIKGDSIMLSIALASIIAKVTRDKYMMRLSSRHPDFKFDVHKGYCTSNHLAAIQNYGLIDEHRLTFKPICDWLLNNDLSWPKGRELIEVDPKIRTQKRRQSKENIASTLTAWLTKK